jgi:hypothetical protein
MVSFGITILWIKGTGIEDDLRQILVAGGVIATFVAMFVTSIHVAKTYRDMTLLIFPPLFLSSLTGLITFAVNVHQGQELMLATVTAILAAILVLIATFVAVIRLLYR